MRYWIIFFTCIIILVPILLINLWHWKPYQSMDVVIIDKTVPDRTYREHQGLIWYMNHQKWWHQKREIEDYIGFHHIVINKVEDYLTNSITSQIERLKQSPLLYIADTYGVYTEDYNNSRYKGDRSSKIYGGLDRDELQVIQDYLALPNKTLIAEFNAFASPTTREVRLAMEDILKVNWSGWIGRHFTNLDSDEVPNWMRSNYETQYSDIWKFTGSGFVLVRNDDHLVVLLDRVHVGDNLLRVNQEGVKLSSIFAETANNEPYFYWFDIVNPRPEAEVLAWYEWDLTKEGMKKLEPYGIPNRFPAVVRYKANYQSYYFAGDYVDYKGSMPFYFLKGMASWYYFWEMGDKESGFFLALLYSYDRSNIYGDI